MDGGTQPKETDQPELDGVAVESRPGRKVRSSGFEHALDHYCEVYGAGLRTIKRWVAAGREAERLPPLDRPADMPAWWAVAMSNRCPDRLIQISKSARKAPPAPAAAAPATPPAGSGGDRRDADGSGEQRAPQSVGFLASLDRMKAAEAEAHAKYLEATKKDPIDEANIRMLQRTWSDLSQQLQAMEKAAPAVLAASGDYVSKTALRRDLLEIHGAIVSGLRSLWRRTRDKCPSVPPDSEAVFHRELDRLLSRLIDSDFAPPDLSHAA